MTSLRIARQAYQRVRQTDLATFAENVYNRMNGNAAYATVQPTITALAAPLTKYKEALAAARNRGAIEVLAKNLSRLELLNQLNVVAKAVEELADNDPQLIVGAGFPIQQYSGQRYNGKLPPPRVLRAASTGKKGEIRILLDDGSPKTVRTHVIEYSLDKGESWTNGAYQSRRNFVLGGLPNSPEMWLHIKSVGKDDNKSDWSEPVIVAVL